MKPFEMTEIWNQKNLLVRKSSPGSNDLLFRNLSEKDYYLYRKNLLPAASVGASTIVHYQADPGLLGSVNAKYWDDATTPIVACWSQTVGFQKLQLAAYRLEMDQNAIPTKGKSVLQMAILPGGHYAAVLSASGSPRKPLLPFIGGDTISGTRYHEVFRLTDAKPIRDPVTLETAADSNIILPCWSPDEEYVIYTDSFYKIWVIPFPPEARKERGQS